MTTTTNTTEVTDVQARIDVGGLAPAAYKAMIALDSRVLTGPLPAELCDLVKLRASQVNVDPRAHGEVLAPAIARCLADAGATPADLGAIVTTYHGGHEIPITDAEELVLAAAGYGPYITPLGSPVSHTWADYAGNTWGELAGYRWTAQDGRTGAGVVLPVHGMGEHVRRYGHVAEALTSQGLVVYGHDLRGHVGSLAAADEPGHLGQGGDHLWVCAACAG